MWTPQSAHQNFIHIPWKLLHLGHSSERGEEVPTSNRVHSQGDGLSRKTADAGSRLGDVWRGILKFHDQEQGNAGSGQAYPLDPLPPHPAVLPARTKGTAVDQSMARLQSPWPQLSLLPPGSDFAAWSLQSGPGCPWQLLAGPSLLQAQNLLFCFRPNLWFASSEPQHALSLLCGFVALSHILNVLFLFCLDNF